jgi:hypothetical protein
LAGTHRSPLATVEARLEPVGDALLLEATRPRGLLRAALQPLEVAEDGAVFEARQAARRLLVEFMVEENRVVMIYDRYLLVKPLA